MQVFELLKDVNSIYGVTVVVVTHYPGVAEHMDRVLHIRDGRISSESRADADGTDTAATEEFLVVDRVGRLQLPQEYVDRLNMHGLAKADIAGHEVNIRPASPGSGRRSSEQAP